MMRPARLLLALLPLIAIPSLAYADDVTYDVSFTSTVGGAGGSGTFTVDSYDILVGVDITLDTLSFTSGGILAGFGDSTDFSASLVNTTQTVELDTNAYVTGDYFLFNVGPVDYGYYTISPAAAPSATPEPSSLILLGTGALGVCGAARRWFVKR